MPSKQIRRNTSIMLNPSVAPPSDPSPGPMSPLADSTTSRTRITDWIMAGKGSNRSGRAGRPKEIDERERKTVDW